MVKSLLNKIGCGVKKAILVGATIASLAGCKPIIPPVDYAPTAKLSSDKTSVKFGESVNLTLEGKEKVTEYTIFDDKDEDDKMDSGEEIITSGSPITNYPWTPTYTGTAHLIGQCTNTIGTGEDDLELIVSEDSVDYVDISGRLEDCENDGTGRVGKVRIYDTKNSDGTYSDILGETTTNSEGEFLITLDNKKVDEDDKVYLRTVTGTFDNPTSYIRTITLDAIDSTPTVRVVPYPDFDSKEGFKEQGGRENWWGVGERNSKMGTTEQVNGNPSEGLKKWSLESEFPENFQGIKVSSQFIESEYKTIQGIVKNSGHPRANSITFSNETGNENENGWIYVTKSSAGCSLYDDNANGYVNHATVSLNDLTDYVVIHELVYHALMACSGHSNSEAVSELYPSMGRYTTPLPNKNCLTEGNIKMAHLIDEPTYLGMEKLDDILGL